MRLCRTFFLTVLSALVLLAPLPSAHAQGYNYFRTPAIISLNVVNAVSVFAPGTVLHVEMLGTPGALATFDVGGVQHGIPMAEVSPGRYEGSLAIAPGMWVNDARIVGHLRMNGMATRLATDSGITIGYAPPSDIYSATRTERTTVTTSVPDVSVRPIYVNVTYPAAGQRVSRDFVVTGTTVPFASLRIVAHNRPMGGPEGSLFGTQTVSVSGMADQMGRFALPVHLTDGFINELGVDLRVRAIDTVTASSRQVEFNIATGGD